MLARLQDPIAAVTTAPGRGAVGIVRISGPDLGALVRQVCGRDLPARQATYLPFRDAQGEAIDHGIAIHFPAPHSYTGEDVLELQGHGGTVVLQMLLARCLEAGAAIGLRLAQPGEFTQRAFLNDKMDLAQAEAVADLVDASTERAVRSANRALEGALSRAVGAILRDLTDLRLLIEATLDFPEEEVDVLQRADVRGRLDVLLGRLAQLHADAAQGALLRDGIRVVIAGAPNAGKSSLLNALAGAELAIVSPWAGTTRDRIEQTIQIDGVPVHVVDTAGLRDSDDAIERMGIERTWREIVSADTVILLHDLSLVPPERLASGVPLRREDALPADSELAALLASRLPAATPMIDVWNKRDRVSQCPAFETDVSMAISAQTGAGLDDLRALLLRHAGWQAGNDGVTMARERHLQALEAVQHHLNAALAGVAAKAPALDLVAEELRLAQNALSGVTAAPDADELLGLIFSRFCIGK